MWIKRIGIYIGGMFCVSLGIVLCARCGMGISPVSSWPYVIEEIVPLSFGSLTMLFHFVNIIFQYVVEKKLINLKVFLQIPIAAIMGVLIDLIKVVVNFDNVTIVNQLLALVGSVFFTAFGMFCMISMNLIQNPPDGAVRQISRITGWKLGNVKLFYDVVMVMSSCLMSYLVLGEFRGLGIATLVSAIFVGRILSWLQRLIEMPVWLVKIGSNVEKHS